MGGGGGGGQMPLPPLNTAGPDCCVNLFIFLAVNSRGQGATDVTTGQPNPAIQATYQSTNTMDPTSALLSSAPQANREVGVMDVGNPAVLYPTVTPEVPSGYRQQPVQNHVS